MNKNTVLVLGSRGMDASNLIAYLLKKGGYTVVGTDRRSSSPNYWRHKELGIEGKFIHEIMDITDYSNVSDIINKYKPEFCFNLAAMSFVADSFHSPISTFDINANGQLNVLEAVRKFSPDTKVYYAATSEMFGKVQEVPQKETTPFYPRSPYGVSKLAGFWLSKNYRESYNLFACSGILFNHESVPQNSPIIIKDENGYIDILPIEDLFRSESHRYEGILNKYYSHSVWNGSEWTKIVKGTSYRDAEKVMRLVQTVSSSYEATEDHVAFDKDNKEVATKDWKIGDCVYECSYPEQNELNYELSESFAKFLGFVVGDGHILDTGMICLTGKNLEEIKSIADIICNTYNYTYSVYENSDCPDGGYNFNRDAIYRISINNSSDLGKWLRGCVYTNHSNEKRIPKFILNAPAKIKKSFFDGYYLADGRKKGNEVYLYKGFTTSSQTLCLGLNYVFKSFSSQTIKTKCEFREGNRYYYTQFGTPNPSNKGAHLLKDKCEIISVQETSSSSGWFFDIQTESGTFCTGSNLFKIHNSPLRGEEFVTRKITQNIAKWYHGKIQSFELGNVNALRDWGDSQDYVIGMLKMLQTSKADDYVLATGIMQSVRQFITECFDYLQLNFHFEGEGVNEKLYVEDFDDPVITISEKYYRPAEVDQLMGDYTKAYSELGWEPRVSFKELVHKMLQADLDREAKNND